jgi:hypothetical protein
MKVKATDLRVGDIIEDSEYVFKVHSIDRWNGTMELDLIGERENCFYDTRDGYYPFSYSETSMWTLLEKSNDLTNTRKLKPFEL